MVPSQAACGRSRPRQPLAQLQLVLLAVLLGAVLAQRPGTAASAPAAPASAAGPVQSLPSCLKAIPGAPELHLPGSPNFRDVANGLRIIRWHAPAAVVFPTSVPQVQAAVLCALRARARPVPRGGGNSFEALSTGDGAVLVIDLCELAGVDVDVAGMTATVGGGARMGNIYTAVYRAGMAASPPRNLSCVGGVWPQLGFGGLMAAGGYGSMSRKYGLLADHVVGARVVDARGQVLTADASTNPDLFFAIRGGGGGTYGIVVEATLRLVEVPAVALGHITYSGLAAAVDVLDRFQRWAPTAPPELTFTLNLMRSGIYIKLYHLGPLAQLNALMAASGLAAFPGGSYAAVACDTLGSRGWLAVNGLGGQGDPFCSSAQMSVPHRASPGGVLMQDREASKYKSAIFTSPIPRAGLAEIVALLAQPGSFWKLFQFKAYGRGAFDATPVGFNAFPYRAGTLTHLEYGTSFGYQHAAAEVEPARAAGIWGYFEAAKAVVGKYESGGRYNGYVSLDDGPDVSRYWGPNYARLRAAKARYDPGNVFRNALSVPPPGGSTTLE